MAANPHFESARSWRDARRLLSFVPVAPRHTAGLRLQGLRVFVRDHKMRELPVSERTLEAHYGGFVLAQSHKGFEEARRWALDVSYGQQPRRIQVAGHEGRAYALGPEVPPDDIDGRMPAVVTWADGDIFFFLASGELPVDVLETIAHSMYSRDAQRRAIPRFT